MDWKVVSIFAVAIIVSLFKDKIMAKIFGQPAAVAAGLSPAAVYASEQAGLTDLFNDLRAQFYQKQRAAGVAKNEIFTSWVPICDLLVDSWHEAKDGEFATALTTLKRAVQRAEAVASPLIVEGEEPAAA